MHNQGRRKSFNRQLFEQHDRPARFVVRNYFQQSGVLLIDNPDLYGIDLISPDNQYRVEVEHNLRWLGGPYPYSTFHLLGRKEDTLKKATHYVIVSEEYSNLAIVQQPILQQYLQPEYLQEVSNTMLGEGEYMFRIPTAVVEFVELPEEFSVVYKNKKSTALKNNWRKFVASAI